MEEKTSAIKFIKELKRKTRKRYNSEEKIAVVLAGFKQEDSIAQICRNHGITPATYYKWSKDFMEAGKHRLQGDTLREANTSEVKGSSMPLVFQLKAIEIAEFVSRII